MVPDSARSVADVGAGDGHLARHLADRGLRVIATERSPGPFARLRAAVPDLDCRMGEGLGVVRPGEVDCVVVAGLGGRSMAALLAAAPAVTGSAGCLVLQPQPPIEGLLGWLENAELRIAERSTVTQSGHSYTVLLVRPHERTRAHPAPPAPRPASGPSPEPGCAPGGGAGVGP